MTPRLPLFDHPVLTELKEIEAERADLARRIQALPKNSHKRVILQDRLARMTMEALKAEADLEKSSNEHRA